MYAQRRKLNNVANKNFPIRPEIALNDEQLVESCPMTPSAKITACLDGERKQLDQLRSGEKCPLAALADMHALDFKIDGGEITQCLSIT